MREFESKYLRLASSPSSCHLNPCPRELPLPTFERHGTESKYLRLTSSPLSCYPSLCAFDLPYQPLRHRHCRPSRTYPKAKTLQKKDFRNLTFTSHARVKLKTPLRLTAHTPPAIRTPPQLPPEARHHRPSLPSRHRHTPSRQPSSRHPEPEWCRAVRDHKPRRFPAGGSS